MRLSHPSNGLIEQGAIFTNPIIERYLSCKTWGIVLTARCDLAHQKSNILNFIPIVDFDDWLKRDFTKVLADRIRKNQEKKVDQLSQKFEITSFIRSTFSKNDIIKKCVPEKERKSYLEELEKMEIIDEALAQNGSAFEKSEKFLKFFKKESEKIIDDLLGHRLPGYYFLEEVDFYGSEKNGYIILLREMQTIPLNLGEAICNGLDEKSIDNCIKPLIKRFLNLENDGCSMITGVLKSPEIEHLTQSFTHLFSRIGLDDFEESIGINLKNRLEGAMQ